MTCEFSIKTFDELTSVDLYHILKARSQVFVVEQNCPYQDMDEVDFDCLHLVAHQNEQLIGYCRIIPPVFNTKKSAVTPSGPIPSIGRVLVLAAHRGDGCGRSADSAWQAWAVHAPVRSCGDSSDSWSQDEDRPMPIGISNPRR